jgi:hypothetical protein
MREDVASKYKSKLGFKHHVGNWNGGIEVGKMTVEKETFDLFHV